MEDYVIGYQKLKKPIPMRGPKDAMNLLGNLGTAELEVMVVIHVDPDMRAVAIETVGIGSMMSVVVEARSIFRKAILSGEHRCIIEAHNHPFQRRASPSDEDRDHISALRSAGAMLGIPVLDAIIMGTKENHSAIEDAFVFPKGDRYPGETKLRFQNDVKLPSSRPDVVSPPDLGEVSTPKKAVPYFDFLRKMKEPTTGVMYLTPDLEPTHIEIYPSNPGDDYKNESEDIFRRALQSPSAKYIILANNHPCFPETRFSETSAHNRVFQIRFGGIVLRTPVIDMLEIDPKGHYSWTEHGSVFTKSKFYSFVDAEQVKIKAACRTNRPDLPPYAWILR